VSTLPQQRPPAAPPAGPLTAGSLCSGYGGLDLAVMAVTGARLAWTAETDRHAAAVLARHWPDVPNLGDVTALDWARVPPVDLVSAGWPCQDISYAGPGAGITEGTRSGLWLTIAVGLRNLRPSYVFLENVAALRTRGSSPTWPRSGMTRNGYAYAPPTPEPRTAATASSSSGSGPEPQEGSRLPPTPVTGNSSDGEATGSWMARRDRQKQPGRNGNGIGTPLPAAIALLPTPMAGDFGADKDAGPVRPSGAKRQTGLPDVIIHRLAAHGGQAGTGEPGPGRLLPTPDTGCSPNGHGRRGGRPGNGHQSGQGLDVSAAALAGVPEPPAGTGPAVWGEYEPAIRRWEGVLGYPAPPPAEPGPSGRPRLSAEFAEWMMGLAPGFVTGVPGIPRTRQLKIIGNGVVPQQAAAALRLLIDAAVQAVPDGGTRAAA
jgi:DNA (cytosine-5)-methyltransferase 1